MVEALDAAASTITIEARERPRTGPDRNRVTQHHAVLRAVRRCPGGWPRDRRERGWGAAEPPSCPSRPSRRTAGSECRSTPPGCLRRDAAESHAVRTSTPPVSAAIRRRGRFAVLRTPDPLVAVRRVAIDHWLGPPTRKHGDIDISTLRPNLPILLTALLPQMQPFAATGGHLLPLTEDIDDAVHNIRVRDSHCDRWVLQVNLEEGDETRWRYRRDPRVTLPWDRAVAPVRSPRPERLPHSCCGSRATPPSGRARPRHRPRHAVRATMVACGGEHRPPDVVMAARPSAGPPGRRALTPGATSSGTDIGWR